MNENVHPETAAKLALRGRALCGFCRRIYIPTLPWQPRICCAKGRKFDLERGPICPAPDANDEPDEQPLSGSGYSPHATSDATSADSDPLQTPPTDWAQRYSAPSQGKTPLPPLMPQHLQGLTPSATSMLIEALAAGAKAQLELSRAIAEQTSSINRLCDLLAEDDGETEKPFDNLEPDTPGESSTGPGRGDADSVGSEFPTL